MMSKTKQVIIIGPYFKEDAKYLPNNTKVIYHCRARKILDSKHKDDLEKEAFLKNSLEADLIIFYMAGNNFERITNLCKLIQNLNIPIAYWSQDSHHLWKIEQKIENKFFKMFIAHKAYLDKFSKAVWLPCAFRMSKQNMSTIIDSSTQEKKFDIAFPHRSYAKFNEREEILDNIIPVLKNNNLTYMLSQAEGGKEGYLNIISNSKVILNISILNDCNLRNFEAWAMNTILLTNNVPDFELLGKENINLFSKTIIFKRDLTDFSEKLQEALEISHGSYNTAHIIYEKHLLIDRYNTIILTCLKN